MAQVSGFKAELEASSVRLDQIQSDMQALLLAVPDRSAHEILGSPDDLKLRSCLTLFALAAPGEPLFRQGLERFYGGEADPRTLALCGAS